MSHLGSIEPLLEYDIPSFNRLIETMDKYSCAVIIGAGVSKRAGYPLWRELLDYLEENVRNKQGYEDYESRHKESGNRLKQASDYRKILNDEYYDLIFDRFTNEQIYDIREYVPVHSYIVDLRRYDNVILTANYDVCLERAARLPREYWDPELNPVDLAKDRIYHIHGCIDPLDPDTAQEIVLDSNDYNQAYDHRHEVHNFLRNCFSNFHVVFLGFSMKDDALLELVKFVRESLEFNNRYSQERGKPPKGDKEHFAFLPRKSEEEPATLRRTLTDLGITPIEFSVSQHYKEYKDIVQAIHEGLSEEADPVFDKQENVGDWPNK